MDPIEGPTTATPDATPPAAPAAAAPAPAPAATPAAQPEVQHLAPGQNDQIDPADQAKKESWGSNVYHGILNALGGSNDVTLARDPATGKMVATAVKSGPGQQWKRIISGAIAGAGAAEAGGGTGPGSTARKFGLGIQGGAQVAQQRQQQQRQDANEDFEAQQKAATSNAQNALLSHQIAESTFRLGRQKIDASVADSDRETNFTKMISAGGEGSQDMGVFPDFAAVVDHFQKMPALHDHQAQGQLVTIPHVDGNGKVDGVHVALVTPDWLSSKLNKDLPITTKQIKDGKMSEETFTIPAGSITNDQASKLLMAQSKDALDEHHQTVTDTREASRTKAQNTKDYAEAGKATAEARATAAGAPTASGAGGGATLEQYPAAIQATVRGLADYTVNPATFPTRAYAKSGQMTREVAVGLAKGIDPAYDETQYAQRNKTRTDFGSGKARATINSLNTAVQHLNRLHDSIQGLNNSHFFLLNAGKNMFKRGTDNPTVGIFKTDANAVANEMATVFKGTGATDQEIKQWHDRLSDADGPDTLNKSVTELIGLMDGRLKALDDQWTSSMGTTRSFHILSPQSTAILQKLGYGSVVDSDNSNYAPRGGGAQAQAQAAGTTGAGPGAGKSISLTDAMNLPQFKGQSPAQVKAAAEALHYTVTQ